MQKLFEHDLWWNWLKFCERVDLSIRMRIMCSLKRHHGICMKFENTSLNSRSRLVLGVWAITLRLSHFLCGMSFQGCSFHLRCKASSGWDIIVVILCFYFLVFIFYALAFVSGGGVQGVGVGNIFPNFLRS